MDPLRQELLTRESEIRETKTQHEEEQIRIVLQDVMQGVKNINYKLSDPEMNTRLSICELILFYLGNFISFLFILPILMGFYTVNPQEAIVIMCFGKIVKIIKKPGLNWYFPIGSSFQTVRFGLQTMELKGFSVPDANGSPLNVSAIVTYKIEDPAKALFNVQGYSSYMHTQALEVLKRVLAKFPYRSSDPKKPSLLADTVVIGKVMKELLQEKMRIAGIDIIRMELMEFSFHPEVAQGLLQIQQAQAKLEARKIVVEGGVGIVKDALDLLDKNNIIVAPESRDKIVTNLLVVVCSEFGPPQPVLKV